MTSNELRKKLTLFQGHCCDLKVETPTTRMWICRVGGGISVERLFHTGWKVIAGGCEERAPDVYTRAYLEAVE